MTLVLDPWTGSPKSEGWKAWSDYPEEFSDDEDSSETPKSQQPQKEQTQDKPKLSILRKMQTPAKKSVSFAQMVTLRNASNFPGKPGSVPASGPTSTSVENEELKEEISVLKDELRHLKKRLRWKDEDLEDADLTVDHFMERIGHERILYLKRKACFRKLKEEKKQLEEENSSFLQEISQLKEALQEKEVLAENVNQLEKERKELETTNSSLIQEITQLKTALEQQQQHLDLTSKISQLETSLKQETARANDAEKRLAHQKTETDCINTSVVILRQQLQKGKKIVEMQKSQCLNHQLVLTNTQNQLTKEREEWQRRNTSLQQEMAILRKVHEERVAASHKAEESFEKLFSSAENQIGKLKEILKGKDAIITNLEVISKEKVDQQEKQLEQAKKALVKTNLDLGLKLQHMEENVKNESIHTNPTKISFDLEVEKSNKLKAASAKVQEEQEDQKQQRATEKSSLSHKITHLREVVQEKETIISDMKDDLMVQLDQVQQQVNEMKEKPKKKTAGQRFLNIFRKSRKKH